MINFDKTNLKDNVLIITNDDGSVQYIPEEGATLDELALFEEFKHAYPNGKPEPIVDPGDPVPTIEDKLAATQKELEDTQNKLIETRASLENINSDVQNFMDYVLSTIPS
jgi:hypothetical protein